MDCAGYGFVFKTPLAAPRRQTTLLRDIGKLFMGNAYVTKSGGKFTSKKASQSGILKMHHPLPQALLLASIVF
jgi:multisubunit Na+/H+ antiporter MnhC subunit